MTNRDRLNQMTNEELSELFCNTLEQAVEKADVDVCDICPVKELCKKGYNGFLACLNKEAEG